jgi:hypothetical protein
VFPFIDQLLAVSFVALLFLFFITTMDSMRHESQGFVSAHWLKLLLIGSMWLLAMTIWVWIQLNGLNDPEFVNLADVPFYNVCVAAAIACAMRAIH